MQGDMVPPIDYAAPQSDESVKFQKTFIEKLHAAEGKARSELGELYDLAEMGEEATIERLMRDLQVQERLDAIIDKCIRRLAMVRALKSVSPGSTCVPAARLPSPS